LGSVTLSTQFVVVGGIVSSKQRVCCADARLVRSNPAAQLSQDRIGRMVCVMVVGSR
jgi:hypothetical protein